MGPTANTYVLIPACRPCKRQQLHRVINRRAASARATAAGDGRFWSTGREQEDHRLVPRILLLPGGASVATGHRG